MPAPLFTRSDLRSALKLVLQDRCLDVKRRPVNDSVTCSAAPAGESAAAVAEASNVTDEDLVGAEAVSVRAAPRRLRHRLAGHPDQVAVHSSKGRPMHARLLRHAH